MMTAGMWASRGGRSHLVASILSVEGRLHRIRRNYFARSRASRTAVNREQHAAEACAATVQAPPVAPSRLSSSPYATALAY
jgi:hypothetical protein